MMLADADDVETDAIGELDLVDELAQLARRRGRVAARRGIRGGEAVDTDFHVRAFG